VKKHQFRRETEAVRGGTSLAKKNGPLSTPIYQTSTFEVTDMQEQVRVTPTDQFYTRYGNPTQTVAENAIAQLEGTDAALLFSSGMAAITTSILSLVKTGDHIVAQRDIYGGVIKFLSQWLPKLGVETTFVDNARSVPTQNSCTSNRRRIPTCGSSTWKRLRPWRVNAA
jgi:cystathionine beta-lyase/cystathionine gamma-synthase